MLAIQAWADLKLCFLLFLNALAADAFVASLDFAGQLFLRTRCHKTLSRTS